MGLNGQFNARIKRLEKIVEDMPSGREVPQPSVADYGKVIGVDENGEYSLENVHQEVPTPTEIDAGKVVKVNASGTGYELEDFPHEVPTPSVSDEGKVPTVDYQGNYVLETPEKELPTYTASDDGKVLTVDGSGATPELVWGEGGGFPIDYVTGVQDYDTGIVTFNKSVTDILTENIFLALIDGCFFRLVNSTATAIYWNAEILSNVDPATGKIRKMFFSIEQTGTTGSLNYMVGIEFSGTIVP